MVWWWFNLVFFCAIILANFISCQDVAKIKLNQIGELLEIAKTLDTKIQGLETRMTTQFEALNNRMTEVEDQLVSRIDSIKQGTISYSQGSSELDLVYQTFAEIFSEERELQKSTADQICSRTQIESLRESLATDECANGQHNCSANADCLNAFIGFRCQCKDGYEGDGISCQDIDECADDDTCHQEATCTNTLGSFSCECNPGFTGDGSTCQDIDECSDETHNCHKYAECHNTQGGYNCSCTGTRQGDGFNCTGCDEPFKDVIDVGCIHIIERSENFETGRKSCQKFGADLFIAEDADHYLRLAQHFIKTGQKSIKKYMWVGVKEGSWLSGRKVAPEEEAPRNPRMGSNKCSYTDGDDTEKFLLWTDPCTTSWWTLCMK